MRRRWQADKSNRRFRKTTYFPRREIRVAGDGQEIVDSTDEVNRRNKVKPDEAT
jgi:hypothetical protein